MLCIFLGILIRRLKKERRARKRVQERLENPTTTEPVKAVQETVASPQSVKHFHGSGKQYLIFVYN